MKKFFVLTAAVAALALPALAEVQVKDILINQVSPKAESTNIRVNLHNNGAAPARVSSVDLQVRANDGDSWQTIKTFNNKNYLKIMPHKNLAPANGTERAGAAESARSASGVNGVWGMGGAVAVEGTAELSRSA
ncbi:hypothetical protein ABS71_08525 [bacterium SCN 62-11]|nr:MAG: hypothetical protein ABS71_08525 [bacterium SCN 62-11]